MVGRRRSLPRGGARHPIHTSAVVLATGGVGQLYAVTTNPKVATADGWALAHRVGATLRDSSSSSSIPPRSSCRA